MLITHFINTEKQDLNELFTNITNICKQKQVQALIIYKTKYSELYLACSIRHSYFGEESNMPIFIIINIKYGKLLKKISAQGVSKSCEWF